MSKRKSLKKDHILFNIQLPTGFQRPTIFDFDTNSCNGIPLDQLNDKLMKIIPEGFTVICHQHDKPVYFKTIQDSQDHDEIVHRNKHGR